MATRVSPRVLLESVDGVTILTFVDTRLVSEDVVAEVDDFLGRVEIPGLERVLINFRGIEFLSSSLLTALMKFSRRVAMAGGRVKLCGIAPDLKRLFKITCFDRLFEIYEDESTALDSF